jgi:hypothetical protein
MRPVCPAAKESAEEAAETRRVLELDVQKYYPKDMRAMGRGKPPLVQLMDGWRGRGAT